jgi:2'-5' RNA ligase
MGNDRFGALQVQQLTLFESQLTPEGSIYTALRHFRLHRVAS